MKRILIISLISLFLNVKDNFSDQTIPSFKRYDIPVENSILKLSTGDFNNDNIVDIALAGLGGTISLLLGNGDITFDEIPCFETGSRPRVLIVDDFNNDANSDILINNILFLGNGDGLFSEEYFLDINCYKAISGDINNDNNKDLIVAENVNNDEIFVMLGNGDGTFEVHHSETIPHCYEMMPFYLEDFDSDGNMDLVVTYSKTISDEYTFSKISAPYNFSCLGLFLGNGDGTFKELKEIDSHYSIYAYVPAACDFNNDGNLDLFVVFNSYSFPLYWELLLGNGNGEFSPSWTSEGISLPRDSNLFIIDGNNDNILDVCIVNPIEAEYPKSYLSFLIGIGEGIFGDQVFSDTNLPYNWGIVKDNFNDDRYEDFVIAYGKYVSVFINENPSLFVEKEKESMPETCHLIQNRPNPFNNFTFIPYHLEHDMFVSLEIYDISGQKVATLVDGHMTAGKHAAVFDGSNLASGVYFYSFESKGFTKTGKMLLIK